MKKLLLVAGLFPLPANGATVWRFNLYRGGAFVSQDPYYTACTAAAAFPTVSSAASRFAYEDRSKVWNAGFFLQNVFDISDRYFVTLGMRVDGKVVSDSAT